MTTFLWAMLAYVRAFLMARHSLAMETAALRQQLAVYKRKQPRPKLNRVDRHSLELIEMLPCVIGFGHFPAFAIQQIFDTARLKTLDSDALTV